MATRLPACMPAWICVRTSEGGFCAMKAILTSKWTKVVVFALCLLPLAILIWRGFHNELGANHIEFITHATGDWTLRFLILTLAITPLRKILHQPLLIR